MKRVRLLCWCGLSVIALCVGFTADRPSWVACSVLEWLCVDPVPRWAALLLIWGGLPTLGAFMLRGVVAGGQQYCHTRRMIQTLERLPAGQVTPTLAALTQMLQIHDRVRVVESTTLDALCYGLRVPRICVTSQLLSSVTAQELEAVLRHERHHLQRRDPLRTLLWTIISGGGWWLTAQREQAERDRELAADRAVIETQGIPPLASVLLKFLATPAASPGGVSHLAGAEPSILEARIDQLLTGRGPAPDSVYVWWNTLGVAGATLLVCLVLLAVLPL